MELEAGRLAETRVLSLLRRKKNYHKYSTIIQPHFFSSESMRQIFLIISDFYSHSSKIRLTTADIKILARKFIPNKTLFRECIKQLPEIRKHSSKDDPVLEEFMVDFSKRQIIKKAVMEGVNLLNQPNLDLSELQQHIEKASSLSVFGGEEYYSYFDEGNDRTSEEGGETRYSTSIPILDEKLKGGVSNGELIIFLAPPERGKTLALVNMGVSGLLQGMAVMHITLEISDRAVARRYDSRLVGKSEEGIRKNPIRIRKVMRRLKKRKAELIIKDYRGKNPKVSDMHNFIVEWQRKHRRKVDRLIVDYADLLLPPRRLKEHPWIESKETYKALRDLGGEFNLHIFTASQSTKRSVNKLLVRQEDMADAFAKAGVGDIIIGICQTPEEEEEDLARLYLAKTRRGVKHPVLRMTMEPKTMFLGEREHKILELDNEDH